MAAPTFTHQDKFSPDKNYVRICWGERSKVLEVELSELQKIIDYQMRLLGKSIVTNGFLNKGNMSYAGGVLTVLADTIVVDGRFIEIKEPMTVTAGNNTTVYLAVWEQEVKYTDTIRKSGNQSGGTVIADNGILDQRLGMESSRRIQVQVQLVTDNSDVTKTYLTVASINASGQVTDLREYAVLASEVARQVEAEINSAKAMAQQAEINAKAYTDQQISLVSETGIPKLAHYDYELTATVDGQTDFDIPLTTFDPTTDRVEVKQNRTTIEPSAYTIGDFNSDGIYTVRLSEGVVSGTTIVISVLKHVPMGPDGMINGTVLAVGSIPLDRLNEEVTTKVNFDAHLADKTNPHNVTAEQIGAVKKSGDAMTGPLSTTSAFPFYLKISGKKTWGFHRSGDEFYIAPSASNDGADLDWSKQIRFQPNGNVSFNGIIYSIGNTSYTTRQFRNIILSTSDPDVYAMQDGDIWIKYK